MENYENIKAKSEETPIVEETVIVEEIPVGEENPYGQVFANYESEHMSKEEFLKNHEALNKTIKVIAIISYVLLGINALTILVNFLVIIDIAILLACTLGVHLKKKKGCAIVILVYGIINVIIGLLSSAGPVGWMWIVFGIIYLTQFNKAEKEYKSIYEG